MTKKTTNYHCLIFLPFSTLFSAGGISMERRRQSECLFTIPLSVCQGGSTAQFSGSSKIFYFVAFAGHHHHYQFFLSSSVSLTSAMSLLISMSSPSFSPQCLKRSVCHPEPFRHCRKMGNPKSSTFQKLSRKFRLITVLKSPPPPPCNHVQKQQGEKIKREIEKNSSM